MFFAPPLTADKFHKVRYSPGNRLLKAKKFVGHLILAQCHFTQKLRRGGAQSQRVTGACGGAGGCADSLTACWKDFMLLIVLFHWWPLTSLKVMERCTGQEVPPMLKTHPFEFMSIAWITPALQRYMITGGITGNLGEGLFLGWNCINYVLCGPLRGRFIIGRAVCQYFRGTGNIKGAWLWYII